MTSDTENSDRMTVVVGTEYDGELRTKLSEVLKHLCAIKVGSSGTIVVGSQEIEQWEITIDGQKIFVESETFIGLSISGPKNLVQRIQGLLSASDPNLEATGGPLISPKESP